jgi:hypothetical protein
MKNKITIITAFCVAFCFAGLKLSAQLSGVYTINQTMGASATNFVSFNALAAALNTSGVSGPVTVNVVANTGPYIEQVTFNAITGTSGTNTITINGNGNTLTWGSFSSATPHTLLLGGADFMDFNFLNIVGTGTSFALVVHLWNGSDDNRFDDCTMSCNPNGTGSASYFMPYSISGSPNLGTTSGNSGNNNVVNTCTLNSGYYSAYITGSSFSPFNSGNVISNSQLRDFYLYGIWNSWAQGTIIRNNTLERLNRTLVTTVYGIYVTSSSLNMIIERNRLRRFFDAVQTSSSTMYVIWIAGSATQGNEIIVRNNCISDMKWNGTAYGILVNGANFVNVYHNTFSFDDPNATGGSIYGIYVSSTACDVRNNLVSITRGGTGSKWGFYYFSANGIISENNMMFVSPLGGIGYVGYYLANYTTLAGWKTANGWDQNTQSMNPQFTNSLTLDYTPSEVQINNGGVPLGVLTDINNFGRNLPAPDYGAFEFFNQQCVGTPTANSVVTPANIVCPFNINSLTSAGGYTVNGLMYQWGSSTVSPLGPFVAIPGATLASYVTPTLALSTWYTFSVSCVNGGSVTIASTGQVSVATTVISNIPYFEGFEGIVNNNDLPNCSWLRNNGNAQTNISANTNNRIPNTGNKFASVFGYNLNNTSLYWTNGLQMFAGVTYSASLFYITEYYGYTNFKEVSINLGTSQSSIGLTPIAVKLDPKTPVYTQLSNTFTVPNSGIYYAAIRVISNSGSFAYYLSWDDLSITAPCVVNPVNLSLTGTNASTVCAGQPVTLAASGANTYTWNIGANTAVITDSPQSTISYIAVGTNTQTGCTGTITRIFQVRPSPNVSIFTPKSNVCAGSPVVLNAIGASTYTWNVGGNGASVTVTPNSNTTYFVNGTNSFGCVGTANQAITVNALPSVSAVAVPPASCVGDNVALTGYGAITYTWASNSNYITGTSVIVSPIVSTIYTVTGTDANGCSQSVNVNQLVAICTGLDALSGNIKGLSVYPNPSNGVFAIELLNGLNKTIEVTDVTGRVVLTQSSLDDKMNVNINTLANGVYYLKVKSDNAVDVIKVVKQ